VDTKPLTLADLEQIIPRLRATLHEAERALQALYDVSGLLTERRSDAGAVTPATASNGVSNRARAGANGTTPRGARGRKRILLKKGGSRARGDEADAVEALLLAFLKKAGKSGAAVSEILSETELPKATVNYRLRSLRGDGRVKLSGNRRSARWYAA